MSTPQNRKPTPGAPAPERALPVLRRSSSHAWLSVRRHLALRALGIKPNRIPITRYGAKATIHP
jgi:hypothetical protein